jgi:hypothetical protein
MARGAHKGRAHKHMGTKGHVPNRHAIYTHHGRVSGRHTHGPDHKEARRKTGKAAKLHVPGGGKGTVKSQHWA